MLLADLRVLYLHGFASSPASRKACFFKERLASLVIGLQIPDLCDGNFERLTLTGQLKIIERAIEGSRGNGEGLVLIGGTCAQKQRDQIRTCTREMARFEKATGSVVLGGFRCGRVLRWLLCLWSQL